MAGSAPDDPFLAAFRGSFAAALRWHQLDALWERIRPLDLPSTRPLPKNRRRWWQRLLR